MYMYEQSTCTVVQQLCRCNNLNVCSTHTCSKNFLINYINMHVIFKLASDVHVYIVISTSCKLFLYMKCFSGRWGSISADLVHVYNSTCKI